MWRNMVFFFSTVIRDGLKQRTKIITQPTLRQAQYKPLCLTLFYNSIWRKPEVLESDGVQFTGEAGRA